MNAATTQLTQPQRKALAETICKYGDVWDRARDRYEAARASRKEAIIRQVAGDGITKAKDNILLLRAKIESAEDELRKLGFELDSDGTLEVASRSSRLAKTIEERLDAEVGARKQALDQTFERARVKLLLAATAEEAEQIVEPLLNFEVTVK
jgi:hypothetical protein